MENKMQMKDEKVKAREIREPREENRNGRRADVLIPRCAEGGATLRGVI